MKLFINPIASFRMLSSKYHLVAVCIIALSASIAGAEDGVPGHAFLKKNCVKSHNANTHKGDVHSGEYSQKRPQVERLQAIFNGKDLTGWDGDPKTWHVKDGAICCSGKAGNTWLIWRGGKLENFELRLQFRHLSGNSGVQVRSIEDKKWSVVGYQAEVAAQANMGLWHHSKAPERYRFSLSNAGEKGHISKDGVKTLTRFAPAEKVRKAFRPGEWNEMVIVGRGPRLTQTVNGVVLSELVDLDGKHATSKGLLALQDHGKGTVVHYKNIHLKVLP